MKKVISEKPEKAFRQGVGYGLEMAGAIIREIVHQGASRVFLDYADEYGSVTLPDGYDQAADPEGYIDFEAYRAPELLTPQAVKMALEAAKDAILCAADDNYIPLDADKFGKFTGLMLTDAAIPEEGPVSAHIAEIVRKAIEPGKMSWDEGIVIEDRGKPKPQAMPKP